MSAERRPEPVDAAGVDDVRPRPGQQQRQERPGAEVDAAPAHGEDLVPLLAGVDDEAAAAADPGVVEQQVEVIGGVGLLDVARNAISCSSSATSATNAGHDRPSGASPRTGRRLGHVRRRHVADRDVAALGGELPGQLPTHPRAATRDHRQLPREPFHRSPFGSWIRSLAAAPRSAVKRDGEPLRWVPSAGLDKVVVVGAGSVGIAVAYACMIAGLGGEIVLYDIDGARVERRGARPQATASSSCRRRQPHGVGNPASVPRRRPHHRHGRREAADPVRPRWIWRPPTSAWSAPALLRRCSRCARRPRASWSRTRSTSSPTSPRSTAGLPHGRVFGSGTVLDSRRFRHLLAQRFGIAVNRARPRAASTATARSSCGPRPRSAARRSWTPVGPAGQRVPRGGALRACSTRSAMPPTASSRARVPPTWPSGWRTTRTATAP